METKRVMEQWNEAVITSETTGATVPPIPLHASEALQWIGFADAALRLGCTERWLRNWVQGKAGPVLESRLISGKICIQPAMAYDHIVKYARREAPGLRTPPGYAKKLPVTTAASAGMPK